MSMNVISPNDLARRNLQSAPVRRAEGAAPQAAKTVEPHKPPVERRNEGASSVSSIIAEATDGDASEATALGALGLARRDGSRGASRGEQDLDDVQEARRPARKGPARNSDDQDASTDPLDRLRRRANADRMAGPGETRATAAASPRTIEDHHERLMTVSTSMARSAVATHISGTFAGVVETIFAGSLWQREPARAETVMTLQMRSGPVAGG